MKNLGAFKTQREALIASKVLRNEPPLVIAATNLRYHRHMKKLTVREAAELCSMAVGTYTSLEKGNPGSGADNLLKALTVMGVDLKKAFVALDMPQGGVVTEIVNGKARRSFPETNSVWLRSRGMMP
ncbi:hypothetical protein CL689_02655 [Candidatus Saccharibacteria bacterium]|nr:hypothetical protein [Candidatus Saccharibacteria bacterium]|tara:strand:+ start:9046 stop:9426 length:381 start_codon:yes stop_codon:yes gene_type:complete